MHDDSRRRGMEIAPFRGLRYDLKKVPGAAADPRRLTAPPYDVISPEEHGRLLAASPYNITRITLGSEPGRGSSYEERGELLRRWIDEGILALDVDNSLYVYVIDYPVPGSSGPDGAPRRAHFVGLIALGRLHPFTAGVVLPHERTFPKVVDDRLRLLEATRTNLESIFLLYSDPARVIDRLLESQCRGEPVIRVEAKPGEVHSLHQVSDVAVFIRLMDFMSRERPIIADGHHRYTTSLRFWSEGRERGEAVPGASWQMMTFANLHGEGLSILATHRLVKLAPGSRGASSVLESLLSKLEGAPPEAAELWLETRDRKVPVRFPAALRDSRRGVARTSYALLHDVVLGEWLAGQLDGAGIQYFKEGTGEAEALASGKGDLLFRMSPVGAGEFQEVVSGGEVFPHKTTYFYPKLWSGLVLWPLEEPEVLALK